jgi:hypothetical protein
MEPKLHAGRFKKILLRGVEDGLVALAHIKRDKVSLTVVTRAATRGDGRMCGFPGWGEVSGAGPPSGCFP